MVLDAVEKLYLKGFTREAIEYVTGLDLDNWCQDKYGESFAEMQAEIAYAMHPNQDKERPYTVYMHIAPNGKKYVGITKCTLNKRWSKGRGYWSNEYFQNAIAKYGWENIDHAILFMRLTKEEAETKEREMIQRFHTSDRRYGYNIEKGGSLNKEVSPETREKLRKCATGKRASEETKRKMSEAHSGEKCRFYGIPVTDEMKEKLRELHSKPVLKMDMDDNVLGEYPSMKAAGESVGVTRQAIRCACIGRSKSCAGFLWRYKDG